MSTELENQMASLEDEVNRRRRNDRRQKWGLFILAMLLLVAVAVIVPLLNIALHQADVSGAQVVTEQAEKKEIAKEAQQALCGTKDTEIFDKDLCEKLASAAQDPVEPPAEPPVVMGPSRADLVQAFRIYCAEGDNCKGADGAPPTADDIAAAFVRFCSDGRCVGQPGQDGKPGEPGQDAEPLAPQYEMVLAAVTDVCATGVCTGPAGRDGLNGENGTNATPEMVLAAVQTYCANDTCRGAQGDPGLKGDKGDPGQSPSSWTFTDKTGATYTCTPNPPGSSTYTCASDGVLP